MITWSFEKFQLEKSGFNFPSSSVWNEFYFFLGSCSEWHSTGISFFVKSCDEIPRMDNELSVNAVLLAVVKVWTVSPECIEVLLLYKIFRWSATLWGSWLFLEVMEPGFTMKFSAVLPFYMLRNCTFWMYFLLLFRFYYSKSCNGM